MNRTIQKNSVPFPEVSVVLSPTELLPERFLKVQKSQLLLKAVFVTLLRDDHLSKAMR